MVGSPPPLEAQDGSGSRRGSRFPLFQEGDDIANAHSVSVTPAAIAGDIRRKRMARRRWRTPSILCLTVALGKLGGLKGCEVLRWLRRFGRVDNCLHCVVRGLVHVPPAGW